ncbi:sodium channel protein 60E isoform X4 [Hylaeus volcanicus]|uniref:sodium channel protein 60E isoform X4 n=1 Tax=Hylaeus volcanicus TaxID=313075 RepID=UPI0023B79ED6|nr:sodium channel protein 60E isoform X4 [Hylaeus volcanicus]
MIPSQAGREECKASQNPPSNGSEDNGFTNRPRVAGLYANLSREELVRFSAGEGARSRDILDKSPQEIGSQRSLNLPTEEFELLDRSRIGISRTPQPSRRGEFRYEPRTTFNEFSRREHGSRDHQAQDERGRLECRSFRESVLEFPRDQEASWQDATRTDPRISTNDYILKKDASSSRASASASILVSPASETSESSPPDVDKPPQYEYDNETPSPIFLSYPLASYAEETKHKQSRGSILDAELEFTMYEDQLRLQDRFKAESEKASASPGSTSLRQRRRKDDPDADIETSEGPSRSTVARLRPPLIATAGASADSGTGDSGSAEIQVDPPGTPKVNPEEVLGRKLASEGENGGKAARTPTGHKQTVKLFTKESLDRLENRTVQLVRDYGFQPKRRMSVEDGAVLPNKFEPFPTELYGRPLEEIDNFIYDETFCVVSKRFRKNYIHRFTATNSWFIFSPWNPIRRYCIFLSTNQYFDYVVMATIILNCAFLAMTETIEEAEYIFLAIYTAEMVIKSIAKGFALNKYTYLRNPWNWLDFVVITSGYATIGMAVGNLAGLRTFRVLRALKTVSIMPGLKTIINALLHSFKQLAEVMTLTIFCLMVFALFALQVYMGELRNKCVKSIESNNTQVDWKEWTWNSSNWAFDEDEEPIICGNATGARHCNESYICLCVGPNPNHGYTNFDNFLWSMLTTFQLITLDYWEDVYNKVLSACGPISVSFFTVVVFFGSFYLINLMLAVVALSYEEEAEITNEERRKDLTDHREDSTFSFDPTRINVKTLAKEKQKKLDARKGVLLSSYTRKKVRRRRRGRSNAGSSIPGQDKTGSVQSRSVTPSPSPSPRHSSVRPSHLLLHNVNPQAAENNTVHRLAPNRGMLHSRQASNNSNQQSSLDDSGVVDDHDGDDVASVDEHDKQDNKESKTDWQENSFANNNTDIVVDPSTKGSGRTDVDAEGEMGSGREKSIATRSGYIRAPINVPASLGAGTTREIRVFKCNGVKTKKQMYTLPPEYLSHIVILDDLPDRNCEKCMQCCVDYEGWLRFQNSLYKVVRDPLFELTITLCIVLNTGFLAMEHHGMSEPIRQALNIGNKVFTSIFTFECLLKLLALSKDFFANGWNNFDLIIVSASLIDLAFELVDGLSVIRGLRLLRVLKLAQSWTTMKVLLSIIISTIGALGNLTLVLVIVIYIFAVIGMQLFSKDYTLDKFYPDPVPRWNFNDFFHSFMMIFRILCGEWIEPLWDCMRAEKEDGFGACFAIFLPALVMGNFMVLNLFLALLLNSFNSEELKQKKEEVGEDSKLARSFDRIRSIMRKNKCSRMAQGAIKAKGRDPQLEKVVRRIIDRSDNETTYAIQETVLTLPKDNVYNRSYQESLNQPVFSYDPTYAQSQLKDDETDESNSIIDKQSESQESNPEECQDLEVTKYSSLSKAPVEERTAMLHQEDPFLKPEERVPKRPWHALVSYVDELTVGGRRDCKGKYLDGLGSFPGFGRSNRRKEPQDCFPRQCYQKCSCIDKCVATAIGKKWIKLRTVVLSVVDTPGFEWMILILIFASSITLCFEDIYLDDNPFLKRILYWTNLGFCALFSIEMLLKWLALGFCKYFTSFWTILDFIIVFVSTFSLLIEENENLKVLRSLRTLRALRPLRAISRWQGMRVNFETFGRSMQLLFRLMTSAGWNDVLESLMVQPPDCDPTPTSRQLNGNCGYPLLAITYFTSFIIISYMIVINMYIAIILENFNQAHQEEEIGIVEDDLEMFYIRWSKYDPHATQFINFSQLSDFIASLDPPLGISKPNMVALVSFNLPIAKGNKIHCLDILHSLVKHVLGHVEESEDFRKLQEQMDIKFKKQFPTRKELEIVSSTRMWKRQDKAARLIQRTIREYITARKERERMAQEVDSQTQTSSPGGGNEGRGGGGWSGKVSAFLHVHRGSRASSRKSSRASDASDFSELGAASAWLFPNLPLLLLPGATGTHEDLLPPALTISRPSPTTEQQSFAGSAVASPTSSDVHNRLAIRRSIAGPTLGRQDAVESYPDEEVPSLPTKRRSLPLSATTLSLNTLHRDIKEAFSRRCGSLRKKHQPTPEHQAPLPIESTDVSILVTEPSPENSAPPSRPAILRRQSTATVVHVVVHRESEEYQETQTDDTS